MGHFIFSTCYQQLISFDFIEILVLWERQTHGQIWRVTRKAMSIENLKAYRSRDKYIENALLTTVMKSICPGMNMFCTMLYCIESDSSRTPIKHDRQGSSQCTYKSCKDTKCKNRQNYLN